MIENLKIIDKSNSVKKRIDWVDIAKGIGILCVLFGHFQINMNMPNCKVDINNYLINSFHMPLFFFLSGYCFSKKPVSFGKFFMKKFAGLMIPYISFSVIWIIYETIVNYISTKSFNFEFLFLEVKLYILQIRLHAIWFLPCMFVLELVFFFIQKISKDNLIVISVITIAVTVFGYYYRTHYNGNLPWNIDVMGTMLFFFGFGYVLKSMALNRNLSKVKRIGVFLLFAVINLAANYINTYYFEANASVSGNNYGNFILYYISALFGTFAIIELSKLLEGRTKFVKYIGANTLVYFGLHQIIYYFSKSFILSRLDLSYVGLWIAYIIIMIVSIVILTAFNELLIKTKLKVVLGKGLVK